MTGVLEVDSMVSWWRTPAAGASGPGTRWPMPVGRATSSPCSPA